MSPRESGVHDEALIQQSPRLIDYRDLHVSGERGEGFRGAHVVVVSLPARGRFQQRPVGLRLAYVSRKGCCNSLRNLVLDSEDVFEVSIVALGPSMSASYGVDELRTDAKPVMVAANATFQHIAHAKFATDVAVVAVILGQGILFGDQRLLGYGAFLWLAFHIFVLAYEEPVLAESFGAQYEDFRANVPRWIPRMTPWRPSRMKE
jgi:hypothetical protein